MGCGNNGQGCGDQWQDQQQKQEKSPTDRQSKGLRRPYIRQGVRREVERNAPRTAEGKPIDPNTGKPIEGKPDLGHKPGNEFRTEKADAEQKGLTQKEFNNEQNNAQKYISLRIQVLIAATSLRHREALTPARSLLRDLPLRSCGLQ